MQYVDKFVAYCYAAINISWDVCTPEPGKPGRRGTICFDDRGAFATS